MTRTISAIYENGVFRPSEPVADLPEHTPVQLTVASADAPLRARRVWGLQPGAILYIAPDFDAHLGDEFWLGEDCSR